MHTKNYMILVIVALALISAGCASPVQTRLAGNGAGVAPAARLVVLAAEEDGPLDNAALLSAIKVRLAGLGYSVAADGEYILDFALSARSADISVSASSDKAATTGPKKNFLQSCKPQVHSLTLVALNRDSGDVAYRGAAEELHCRGTLAESLPHLVDALATDITRPGGIRLLSRKGRN